VLCLDPERIRSSRIASNVFPKSRIVYKVTTQKEFRDTVNQFYGAESVDTGDIGDLLSGLSDDGEGVDAAATDEVSAAADNELVKLVNKIVVDAYNQGASDIHIEPYPESRRPRCACARTDRSCPTSRCRRAIAPRSWRASRSCATSTSRRRGKPQDGKIKFKNSGRSISSCACATIPTQGGVEDIVMRILAAGEPIPLDKLGLTKLTEENLKKTVEKPVRPVLRLRADRLGQDHHACTRC
jgi:type II secretory ATPase GspE/PulE/Tfp pilus assembly ATPase PilB-like protein